MMTTKKRLKEYDFRKEVKKISGQVVFIKLYFVVFGFYVFIFRL